MGFFYAFIFHTHVFTHAILSYAMSYFFGGYCQWLAPLLIDADPLLREFKSSSHELTIERFRELDAKVASITSEYVIALASKKIPQQNSKNNPPEFGVLARELQKKSRHIPTRALIDQLGESLLDLCPCLMMSPLSVAQFLPSDFRGFDLVVFDEASQMTTWDSVGAIARGKNVKLIEATFTKRRFWQKFAEQNFLPEQRKVLNRLLDGGEKSFEDGISAAQYQKVAKVSKASATRHLSDLLNRGCLQKTAAGGRSTRYKINTSDC